MFSALRFSHIQVRIPWFLRFATLKILNNYAVLHFAIVFQTDDEEQRSRLKRATTSKMELLMKELQKLMKHNGKRICLQCFVTRHLLSLFSYLNMTPSFRIWFFDTSNWILLPEVWGILWRLEQCWKPCSCPLLYLQLCEYSLLCWCTSSR